MKKRSDPIRTASFGPQHLQRDVAVVSLVARKVNRRHPAATDLPLDRVAAREGGVEA